MSDLDLSRADKIATEISECAAEVPTRVVSPDSESWQSACAEADLVVQATPMGMKPEDSSPLQPNAFHAGQMVYDLVYMYPETRFMQAARAGGAQSANGLGMLMHQGARSFTIWTGREADTAAMTAALEREVYGDVRQAPAGGEASI